MVAEADAFLQHVRFGRDCSELTTRSYAGGIALFLRWCARTGRHWHDGVAALGLFITWLRHAGPQASGVDRLVGGQVLAGPGAEPVRGARRINGVLTAVRGFVAHAVTSGQAPSELMGLIYELADESDLPAQARGEEHRMAWRMRARHRLHEPEATVDRASDAEIVAWCGLAVGAGSADRVVDGAGWAAPRRIVWVAAFGCSSAGRLACAGLRVSAGSPACCASDDNPNGAWAKSRRQRVVPLDFLVVQAFDGYEFERLAVPRAGESDFLLVNLFREPIGAPMRPDAINEVITACHGGPGLSMSRRIGCAMRSAAIWPMRAAGLDEIADFDGSRVDEFVAVYLHPDPGRLREAVDRVTARVSWPGPTGERPRRWQGGCGRPCGAHVFVGGRIDRHAAAIAAVSRAGVPRRGRLGSCRERSLSFAPEHPLLGRPVCRAAGCSDIRAGRVADLRLVPASARRKRAR